MRRPAAFIRPVVASKCYHPDGTVDTERRPAVWTLAHRGYSGGGRLDLWVYPTRRAALRAGAELAMASGLDEDPHAQTLFTAGRWAAVLERYEQTRPQAHLLRVEPAFLQLDEPHQD